jgi:hypothetical protein
MYWDPSLQDKVALNLPKSFNKKLYEMKMGGKPIFKSPHTRDLMNQVDKILTTAIPFQIQQKSNYFLKF